MCQVSGDGKGTWRVLLSCHFSRVTRHPFRGVCSLFFWLSTLNHQPSTPAKLAASPGFAPGPPVSETGALLITPRGNSKWLRVDGKTRVAAPGESINHQPFTINIANWSPGKVLPP